MLIDLLSRIERFFKRLESYTEVQPTATMTGIIVEIMVEVLVILAIATKEIKQRRSSESIDSWYIILDSLFLRSVCGEVTGKEQD